MSYRVSRVEEVVRRELGLIMSRDLDYGGAVVMINHISMTPDLRQCHIYFSVTGNDHKKKEVLNLLNKNRVLIQRKLSKRVILKNTPLLSFKIDDSTAGRMDIVNLIDELEIPDV